MSTTESELSTRLIDLPGGAADRRWRALRYFSLYRIVVSGLFAVLGLSAKLPPNFTEFDVRQFALTACVYLGCSVVAQIAVEFRTIKFNLQVYGQALLDILLLTLFIRASGGVGGGFGILLVVALAGACLFLRPRAAIFFAALSTLAILGETILGTWHLGYPTASYTQAGLLGAALFGTAVLASFLAEQARRSEELAQRRAVDIENLSRLNEYIVQRMRSGILVLDDRQQPVLVNEAARTMIGPDGASDTEEQFKLPLDLISAHKSWRADEVNSKTPLKLHNEGVEVVVSFTHLGSGSTGGTLVFLEDAAELRQRAQQLKLASLGRLTGSIAHEIRNPLGAISHAGQLLSESPQLVDQDKRLTEIIAEQSRRVNTIIENVMTIGRRQIAISESFALRGWLDEFVRELTESKALDGDAITCEWLFDDVMVRMDKSQLHQVLWNLCENALRYSTGKPLLAFVCGRQAGSARPMLDLVDQGPGMSEEVAEQVFEPFYTGETTGTGLGLYIARELCESNQASLILVSHDTRGCRFRINFAPPERQQLTD
ncbi:MAG: sensor histidine kinase [Gammaproteobacteria bacterium]